MREIFDLLAYEIEYLKKLKMAVGDLNGHIHGLTVKMSLIYLSKKHPKVKKWSVCEKYSSGRDVVGNDEKGKIVVAAEIKTTYRAVKETLGSTQRKTILKDIHNLSDSGARYQYLFVIDNKNKEAIKTILKNACCPSVKLMNIFDV